MKILKTLTRYHNRRLGRPKTVKDHNGEWDKRYDCTKLVIMEAKRADSRGPQNLENHTLHMDCRCREYIQWGKLQEQGQRQRKAIKTKIKINNNSIQYICVHIYAHGYHLLCRMVL
jgi:hypothetical protein